MRHVIFECDYCGLREETPADKPMPWTELTSIEGTDYKRRRFYCQACWRRIEPMIEAPRPSFMPENAEPIER